MKKIILALAFVAMPTMTIVANLNSKKDIVLSKKSVPTTQIEDFFKTESFLKISKNFNIKKENFDLKTTEVIKINETSNLIRLKVSNGSRIDYVTLMPYNNAVLYEKTLINQSGNGKIEQYDENGTLVADFDVKKEAGKYNVKLSFVNPAISLVDQLSCIKETYDYINKNCDSDTACSITCDLSPQCAVIMYGVAAAHCAASGNKPVKAFAPIG